MDEYEVHVSASYTSQGGSKEWTYFKVYTEARSKAAAEKMVKEQLKEHYKNIRAEAIKV